MKCADQLCHRNARPGSSYCSDLCVPAGSSPSRKPTRYEPATDESSSEEDGEDSEPLLNGERPTPQGTNLILLAGNRRNDKRASGTSETQKNHAPQTLKNINANEREPVENDTETMTENAPELRRPHTELEKALPNFAGETFRSKSLIGDSVKQLHELMSDVGNVIRKKGTDRIDPQLVNAACNCAKQIGSLLKLQLEHDKNAGRK